MISNNNPKVSVVLPTYNGARYLRNSVESCLNQTYKNIELIIVDDCSTDETPDIVHSFNDPRIRYVRNETNQRLPRSLNIGFALATGEYLTWTSDDNEFLPQAIENMLKILKDDQTVDFVYADYTARYLENGKIEQRRLPDQLSLEKENCIGACFLYTRRVYERLGGFDPKYELVEDYEYWIRVSKHFRFKHIPQFLYIYGEHWKSLKGSRMININLCDKVLKYQYGFITRAQLTGGINRFLTVSIDCRKSMSQWIGLWLKTMRQMCNMSFFLSILFIFYSLYLLIFRMAGYVIKKSLWPVRKWIVEQKIRRLVSTLKATKDKPNILCAVPAMTMGGAQKVVLTMAQGLKEQGGYSFHLVATKKADQHLRQAFSEVFKNIVVIEPLPDEDLYEYYYTKIIEVLNIDILLISHPVSTYKFISRLKQRFKNLKIVDILHLERVGGTRDELSWLIPHMDKRICISRHLCKYMAAKYQAFGMSGYADRLTTIYNGIDLTRYSDNSSLKGRFKSKFRLADNVKLISFIARFAVEKEPLLFVDIARSLLENHPPVPLKFVMAGDGYLLAKVKEEIRGYGLEDHFILPGMLNNGQELLADTHLFLLTSNHEGIPLTVMEALAMNVPVVSTVVGGVEEILHDGVNGYLIAQTADMKNKFSEKILDILGDDSLYRSLSMNTKGSLFKEYSIETMSKRYKEVFEELMTSASLKGTEQNFTQRLGV